MSSDRRDWPHDLKSLQTMAIEEILPRWEEETNRPDRAYPTIEWLTSNGYSHLRWILEKKHGMTVGTFFSMIVGRQKDNEWNIDDPKTIAAAEDYLDEKEIDRKWAESTHDTMKSKLNMTFDEVADILGHDRIIDALDNPDARGETYEAFKKAIRRRRRQSRSDPSTKKYLRAIVRFGDYLERNYIIEENIISSLSEEFNFESASDGADRFSPDQIARMWDIAATPVEYMLIIGYVIWGLRTQELPKIHKSQFIFEEDELKIEFKEDQRKNGSGTVIILFGVDYIIELLAKNSHASTWSGHLIPDPDDHSEPMDAEKARHRFEKLCQRADVEINGETPTPKNGRATWYDMQERAISLHIELLSDRVEPQGAVDPESASRYPTEETKNLLIRLLYYIELKPVLPSDDLEQDYVFLRTLRSLDDDIDLAPLYQLYDNLD